MSAFEKKETERSQSETIRPNPEFVSISSHSSAPLNFDAERERAGVPTIGLVGARALRAATPPMKPCGAGYPAAAERGALTLHLSDNRNISTSSAYCSALVKQFCRAAFCLLPLNMNGPTETLIGAFFLRQSLYLANDRSKITAAPAPPPAEGSGKKE